METLEREGRVTREQIRTLRKKLSEVEKNLSKVYSSSIRDQIMGAFFASTISGLVNRKNFVAIVQAVGSSLPAIGHQGP